MSLHAIADHMATKGRGPDTMLIHMAPSEVQGLQALAMAHGGSLTINPETGLPEAGFLDKLLPTIIGAGLTFFSGGAINPMMAAGIVGGIQTVRTGDLGKGLAAGLGAYGGAGLTSGLTTAGTGALSAEVGGEALRAAGLTGEAALTAEADQIAQRAIGEKLATATPYETLSAGAGQAVSSPQAAGAFFKDNAKNLMYAAGPAILAGANVQAKGPQTTTKPGMIRPYSFDPYGGTYTAGTPYEATPAKPAAHGGLMGLAAGGMAGYEDDEEGMSTGGMGGMFNFAQQSEPVVRMASGGIAGYAGNEGSLVGEDAALKAYQEGRYKDASTLLAAAGMGAQDVVSKYGLSQADAATVAKNLGYAGDMSGIQYAAPPPVAQVATATAAPVVQAQANTPMSNTVAAPTYTNYTTEQMGSFLSNPVNKDINIQDAIKATNADPAAVNRYIASLTNPFVGSTDTTGGSGTLGIYNQMTNIGVDPTEFYSAAIANDPKYAGWTKEMIQKGYDLDKGAYALTAQIEKDKIAADPVLGQDKQWVKFMDDNKYSIDDMAQAFGLSRNEVKSRYDAVKAAETKVVTKTTLNCPAGYRPNAAGTACELIGVREIFNPPGTGGGTTIIPGINDYGLGGTGTSGSLESVYGPALPPGVSGAGITTVNPNGTITTRPNIPGIPEGGFTGMKDVRDTYEKGGGSLGVNKYLFAPTTTKQIEDRYKLTGGSKQSFDYLMGKTPYSPTPYTPTGEIMKPYFESVGRAPVNLKTKKYVYVDGKYQLNPEYVKPSYVLAGEKAAADKAAAADKKTTGTTDLTNQDEKPTSDPGSGNEWLWDYASKKWFASPIQVAGGGDANGGLMKLAGGGMSGRFNLGDYSDGGRLLRGPGDGVSDSIPASIGGKRPARLADGEFVVPARIVSELGNGSTEAGARKLYAMMDRIQKARQGTVGKGRVAKNSRSEKYLPA